VTQKWAYRPVDPSTRISVDYKAMSLDSPQRIVSMKVDAKKFEHKIAKIAAHTVTLDII
jgi:hypothetical protein